MAFESLSERIQEAFKKLRGKGKLSEADVNEVLKDMRRALLEAEAQHGITFRLIMCFLRHLSEGEAIATLRKAQRSDLAAGARLIKALQESLPESFCRLGLTDAQEKILQDLVGGFTKPMLALVDRDNGTQVALQRLNARFARLRRASWCAVPMSPCMSPRPAARTASSSTTPAWMPIGRPGQHWRQDMGFSCSMCRCFLNRAGMKWSMKSGLFTCHLRFSSNG